MPTAYTSLLGLALPVTGELSGTWGDTVNNAITSLLDTAIAGTTTLSTDADVTLTTTTGASNQARQAILLCNGARTGTKNITAPATSKTYVVINSTTGGFGVVIRGAGPTTGVTIANGERAVVAWNGSDFVKISGFGGSASFTDLTVTGNTILGDAAGDTITVNGATTFTNVNPTLSAGTANGVAYLNGSKVLTSGSGLVFDGTNLGVGVTPANASSAAKSFEFGQRGVLWATTSSTNVALSANGYLNAASAWTYKETGTATAYQQDGEHKWFIAASGTAGTAISFTNELRLTSTGLGVTQGNAPTQVLNLYRSGSTAVYMAAGNSNTSLNGTYFGVDTAGNGIINQTQALALIFSTNNTERARLDSSGNLGLGVTPSAWAASARTIDFAFPSVAMDTTGAAVLGFNAYNSSGTTWNYRSTDEAALFTITNAGAFTWRQAASGTAGNAISFTQAMTLDASGNLLVNRTTASGLGKLNVDGGADFTGGNVYLARDTGAVLVGTSSTGADGLGVSNLLNLTFPEGSGTSYANLFRQASSAATVIANGYKRSATASGFASSIGTSWAKTAIGLGVSTGAITFYTDAAGTVANGTDVTPTERARIDSSGNLLVGTTNASPSAGSGIKDLIAANGASAPQLAIVTSASTNTTSSLALYSTGAAAYRFYVGDGGTIYATSTTITAISDQRLKENIRDLDAGLSEIMALKPRKFDWKAGKGKDKKNDRGWIAQEFEQVFPDMVDTWQDPAPEGEEPYKAVNADLIPVLVKAIQELTARVAQLERQ